MLFLNILCIAAATALSAPSIALPQATETAVAPVPVTLSVTFTGMKAKQGRVMLAVYDEAGWQSGTPVRAEMIDVTDETVELTLTGISEGRFGVKAFHDINANGKMDTNPFGMPTEPFAFSNNARGAMGQASWADAAFAVTTSVKTQTITIR